MIEPVFSVKTADVDMSAFAVPIFYTYHVNWNVPQARLVSIKTSSESNVQVATSTAGLNVLVFEVYWIANAPGKDSVAIEQAMSTVTVKVAIFVKTDGLPLMLTLT